MRLRLWTPLLLAGLSGCAIPSTQEPLDIPSAAEQPAQETRVQPDEEAARPRQSEAPPIISAGECWVYAPIKPRPVSETVEVVVRDSAVRIDVTPAEIEQGYRRVVTREGVKTYRIAPATFKQVTERVMVKPEIPRFIVVPAVYEEREAVLEVEEARTVLEPCRAAGTRYSPGSGAMAFCAREVPAKEEVVKVQVLVEPETTRVEYEPAEYETVTRWVVDQPARVIEVVEEPEETTIAVNEVARPEQTAQRIEPAVTRNMGVTRFEGEPRVVSRPALCDTDITEGFVRELQRRLKANGYDPGAVDGLLGRRTVSALTDYQVDNGLAMGALTLESLEHLELR